MFIDCLLYVGVTTSGKGSSHYLSFTDEETEVLRGTVTYSDAHASKWLCLNLNPDTGFLCLPP